MEQEFGNLRRASSIRAWEQGMELLMNSVKKLLKKHQPAAFSIYEDD